MKRVEYKLFRTGRDLKVGVSMKQMITKAAGEKVKVKLDFYNYFNKDDRFLLTFNDVNIITDLGLTVSDVDYSSNRYVELYISGGNSEVTYEVDVIIMLSDGQSWTTKLSIFIGYENGY